MAWQYAALAGFKILAGFQQASLVDKQLAIQRQIDEQNAKLAEYDAWRAEVYGQTQVAEYQQQVDQAQAKARVSAAAEGVSTREGSLADIIDQNEMIALSNRMKIEAQTRERALGYRRQADNIRLNSAMRQAEGEAKKSAIITGSLLSAGGDLVGPGLFKSPSLSLGSESGYSLPSLPSLQPLSTPGSYLTGSSQDIGGTGYLGLP